MRGAFGRIFADPGCEGGEFVERFFDRFHAKGRFRRNTGRCVRACNGERDRRNDEELDEVVNHRSRG